MTNTFERIANWNPPINRRDPLTVLREQEEGRIPWLLLIRHGRMAANLFAHVRGSAAKMVTDLASQASSRVLVQLCGDAHVLNIGFYTSPERSLLFDIVDFNETYLRPFEWDLKRLPPYGQKGGPLLQKKHHGVCRDANCPLAAPKPTDGGSPTPNTRRKAKPSCGNGFEGCQVENYATHTGK